MNCVDGDNEVSKVVKIAKNFHFKAKNQVLKIRGNFSIFQEKFLHTINLGLKVSEEFVVEFHM